MKIISFINNKGGAAKTASCTVIAELLACLNYKVLLVDLDEQSNLSMQFRKHEDTPYLIDNVLTQRYNTLEQMQPCIQKTYIKNIDIIANYKERKSTVQLITADTSLNNNILLKKALAPIKDNYDFILIDTAPASNILIINAMYVSDYVITPVKAEENSYEGLETTLKNINRIVDEFDINTMEFLGVFMTVVNKRTKNFQEWSQKYRNELGNKFFNTSIRCDAKLEESQTKRKSLIEIDPRSRALNDYANLLLEMKIIDQEHEQALREAMQI